MSRKSSPTSIFTAPEAEVGKLTDEDLREAAVEAKEIAAGLD